MSERKPITAAALAAALAVLALPSISAQGTAIPSTIELGKAPALLAARCSGCHDWAASRDAILASGLFVPGKPEESPAWIAVSADRMPADGPLDAADKELVRAWLAAGAPAPAASAISAAPLPASRFLGFQSKEAFHRFSGWMAGGALLAAGIVGTVHVFGMMNPAHAYRDSLGLGEFNPATCDPEIASVWGSSTEQALRWTHVGLLAAGESFYLANAVTGTSFMGKLPPGWSKPKIHRYAFFTHAGLMAAEAVLGFVSSDALRRGDHDTFHTTLVLHAGIGLTIPVVILGAGAIMGGK